MLTAIHAEGLEIQDDVKWLESFQKDLQPGHNLLLMAGVEPHVLEIFKKIGFSDLIGEENIFWPNRGMGRLWIKPMMLRAGGWKDQIKRLIPRPRI